MNALKDLWQRNPTACAALVIAIVVLRADRRGDRNAAGDRAGRGPVLALVGNARFWLLFQAAADRLGHRRLNRRVRRWRMGDPLLLARPSRRRRVLPLPARQAGVRCAHRRVVRGDLPPDAGRLAVVHHHVDRCGPAPGMVGGALLPVAVPRQPGHGERDLRRHRHRSRHARQVRRAVPLCRRRPRRPHRQGHAQGRALARRRPCSSSPRSSRSAPTSGGTSPTTSRPSATQPTTRTLARRASTRCTSSAILEDQAAVFGPSPCSCCSRLCTAGPAEGQVDRPRARLWLLAFIVPPLVRDPGAGDRCRAPTPTGRRRPTPPPACSSPRGSAARSAARQAASRFRPC